MNISTVFKCVTKTVFRSAFTITTFCALVACGGGSGSSSTDSSSLGGGPPSGPPNTSGQQPTVSSGGTVIYPVVNNFNDTMVAGKTVSIAIPGYGYAQLKLNNDALAATSTSAASLATMTCTDFVKSGAPAGSVSGTWSGSGTLSLTFPDKTFMVLRPEAGDVINNAFVIGTTIHDGPSNLYTTYNIGGSRIFLAADPATGLAQAAAYYSATETSLPMNATQTNPILTDASFSGRTMYISSVFSGYAKITFAADHTCTLSSAMSKVAAPISDLDESQHGTWAVSGTNKLIVTESNDTTTLTITRTGREAMYNVWNATLSDTQGTTGALTEIFFDAANGLAQAASFYQTKQPL